jgi:hypothetical protein
LFIFLGHWERSCSWLPLPCRSGQPLTKSVEVTPFLPAAAQWVWSRWHNSRHVDKGRPVWQVCDWTFCDPCDWHERRDFTVSNIVCSLSGWTGPPIRDAYLPYSCLSQVGNTLLHWGIWGLAATGHVQVKDEPCTQAKGSTLTSIRSIVAAASSAIAPQLWGTCMCRERTDHSGCFTEGDRQAGCTVFAHVFSPSVIVCAYHTVPSRQGLCMGVRTVPVCATGRHSG